MKMKQVAIATTGLCIFLNANTVASVTDMYLTNSGGDLFRMDGNTLEATFVRTINNTGPINDIEYLGDGRILANLSFSLDIIDLQNDTQETLFNSDAEFGIPSAFTYTSGLAAQSNGQFYFSVNRLASAEFARFYGVSYDLNSGSFTELADVPGVALIDHYELSNGQMLAANYNSPSILVYNPLTGVLEDEFSLGFSPVSFVQSDDQLLILSDRDQLYSFESSSGNTNLIGTITGTTGTLIGATIPAPSSLCLLGFASLAGLRRRAD